MTIAAIWTGKNKQGSPPSAKVEDSLAVKFVIVPPLAMAQSAQPLNPTYETPTRSASMASCLLTNTLLMKAKMATMILMLANIGGLDHSEDGDVHLSLS